jgi:diguanylate cyclase (GGDEF)-like protein/PAS domain S-box-containing protein
MSSMPSPHPTPRDGLPVGGGLAVAALDAMSASVCVLDGRGIILSVNRSWRDFVRKNGGDPRFTCEGADYVGACERTVDPARLPVGDEPSVFLRRLRDVLAGRSGGFQHEYPCHSPQQKRWFIASVTACDGPGAARAVIVHQDVTSLWSVQERLRERGALLQDLAESMPGAVFRFVAGARGELDFRHLGEGTRELFEMVPDMLRAQPALLALCVVEGERAAFVASLGRAVASGSDWEHEFAITTRSGARKHVHALARAKKCDDGVVAWTGVFTDVTARKQYELWFAESEAKFRTLYETSPTGVVYQDADGRITDANPAAQRILGLTFDQMQGRTSIDPRWRSVREDGSDFPGEEHPSMVALRTGQPVRNVVMGVQVPGREQAWILINAIPITKQGRIDYVYASFEDITERRALANELRQQALTDSLTGVPNRRSFLQRLEAELARVKRRPEIQSSVLAIDLDYFKRVNDELGHAAGDEVLKHFAGIATATVRRADVVGRSGGEEFLVMLPDTNLAEARLLADRLRRAVVESPANLGDKAVPFTVSIGIAVLSTDDVSIDAALARADRALYDAKRSGRNMVRP